MRYFWAGLILLVLVVCLLQACGGSDEPEFPERDKDNYERYKK